MNSLPDAPLGWTRTRHFEGEVYVKDRKKIRPMVSDGQLEFVISEHQAWVPGCYSTVEAAAKAFDFDDTILCRLRDAADARGDSVISMEELQSACAETEGELPQTPSSASHPQAE